MFLRTRKPLGDCSLAKISSLGGYWVNAMRLFDRVTLLIVVAVLAGIAGCSESRTVTTDGAAHQDSKAKGHASNQAGNTLEPKGPIAPPRRDVPGRRGELSIAKIYVPDHFVITDGEPVDVVIWFHGAPWCAEQVFYDSRKNAVLVTVTAKNLWETFRRQQALENLLEETNAWLSRQSNLAATDPIPAPEEKESPPSNRSDTNVNIGRVCLASFSGGYVAVREILKQPQYQEIISDVVLADSLYAPRVKNNENKLDPAAMEPFLNYARRATAGKCNFIFSHLYPPLAEHRGNTTTLAANYLIDQLGIKRKPAEERIAEGIQIAYKAESNGFHVFGYTGMTTQDHFEHLYKASHLLKLTSLAPAK